MSENWQTMAAQYAQAHHLQHDPDVHALDLMSEVGEVAKELLLASDYGRRPAKPTPNLSAELGDALYSLCLLATAVGVELDSALQEALDKYEQRWQAKGHSGSQPS